MSESPETILADVSTFYFAQMMFFFLILAVPWQYCTSSIKEKKCFGFDYLNFQRDIHNCIDMMASIIRIFGYARENMNN